MWAAGYRRTKSRMARAIVDLVGGRCRVILEADCGGTWSRCDCLPCDVNGNEDEHVRFRRFARLTRLNASRVIHARKKPRTKISWPRRTGIEREVQVENVHTRFAEKRRDRAHRCFAERVREPSRSDSPRALATRGVCSSALRRLI